MKTKNLYAIGGIPIKSGLLTAVCFTTYCLLSIADSFSQGTWTEKTIFAGTARWYAATFSIGNKGYIGTGYGGSYKKDFWEWDQISNVWTQKADFGGTARAGAVGFSIGTKGYMGTGEDVSLRYRDFWEWDQATNTWTQKADFGGSARRTTVSFSIGMKGYIGTGYDGAFKQDFWEWDQGTNSWTQKADFGGSGRCGAVGFAIGTKAYIGTGGSGIAASGTYYKDFWEWDQTTNTWTQKADFGSTARISAAGFAVGTKGYIGTGLNGNTRYQDFWEWDQTNNVWTQQVNFGGTARTGAIGFSIGAYGYMGTGEGPNYKQDYWEYDPHVAGINELNGSFNVSVYPNPLYFQAIFTLSKETRNSSLHLFDLSGKEVKHMIIPNGVKNFILEKENIPSGIYFYKIISGNQMVSNKLIIR